MKIILILLFYIFGSNNGEYYIYKNKVPSYLYNIFNDVKENPFPIDIYMNLSLSKMDGILLYIIDRHLNQLIVSISNPIPPILEFELNGDKTTFSLEKLCICYPCMYEMLNFRIKTKGSVMKVWCNKGDPRSILHGSDKRVNTNYPIPFDQAEQNNQRPNETHLWLVNFPQDKDVSPRGDQLAGCIFNVMYNNREIIFTKITDNIKRECTKTCIGEICNGGQCYETYNTVPVCNCTRTFKNGLYCNDPVTALNVRSVSQQFGFGVFKLSWNGSATELMKLENRNVLFHVYVRAASLIVEYRDKETKTSNNADVIWENYKIGRDHILIGIFKETSVDIQTYDNGSWFKSVIKTERDLSKGLFDSLELHSGDGVMDLAIKTKPSEYAWRRIEITDKYIKWDSDRPVMTSTDVTVVQTDHTIAWIVVVVLSLIVAVIVTVFVIKCRGRRIRRRRGTSTQKNEYTYNVKRDYHDCATEDCPDEIIDEERYVESVEERPLLRENENTDIVTRDGNDDNSRNRGRDSKTVGNPRHRIQN